MFRNMVTSLLKYERIHTTDAKAKELSRWADYLITLAKKGDLHSRRQALSIVREKKIVHKLFEEAKHRYGERPGGHTRIVKLGYRPGDAARISFVELTDRAKEEEKKTKKKKTETAKRQDSIEAGEKPAVVAREKKAPPETKKQDEIKKKKSAKPKPEPKKAESKKEEKKASTKLKKDKAKEEKKPARPKKKADAKDKTKKGKKEK